MAGVFNVKDYGAVGNGLVNDRDAIQAAVNAANAAGGGVVYLPPGTYGIGNGALNQTDAGVQLYSNITLRGEGQGVSTLMVLPGNNADLTGMVRTPYGQPVHDVVVENLTLDGNRDQNPVGKVDGFFCGTNPGSAVQVWDITVRGVEAKDCSGYGFDPHEQTLRLLIENCVAHGNGLDGFALDFLIQATVRNNVAYANDRHGFNVVTQTHDSLLEANVAYANGGNGITVQRGSEDIPAPYNLTIRGGEVYGNGLAGVLLRFAHDIRVENVFLHDNQREGVKVYGSSDNVVIGNRLENNSQAGTALYNEIYVDNAPDTVTGQTFVADDNIVSSNVIIDSAAIRPAYGIKTAVDTTDTAISSNSISGPVNGLTLIQGTTAANPGDVGQSFVGGAGRDFFWGEGGDDTLQGGDGQDYLRGGDGNDSMNGGAAFDDMHGNKGADTLQGGQGSDWVVGGQDNDLLSGGQGDDYVVANLGVDSLYGDLGNDTLLGGQAEDRLFGGDGNDFLSGDRDADIISGGLGADTFYTLAASGADRVTDFSRAEGDRVMVEVGQTWNVAQVGANVVVTLSGGATLTLEGVNQASLTGQWIFAG
ncbi:MAG TPA: right-handed parallel beta-helix repeat-containing protein [Phenylobacterium sp.]